MRTQWLMLVSLCAALGAAETAFDFRDGGTHGWEARRGLELTPGASGLVMKILSPGCELMKSGLGLQAASCDTVEIRYRAVFPAPVRSGGYLFFAAAGQAFAEERKFYLPKLVADGQPQRIVVGFRQLRGGEKAWRGCGVIDQVRLDITNDAPGQVELLSVRFTTAARLSRENADQATTWRFPQDAGRWSRQRHLERQATREGLCLKIFGYDSNIEHPELCIDAAKYRRIRIEYKATGLPRKTSGEIFFATEAHPAYADGWYFRIPSLQVDGKWHRLTLDAEKDIPAGGKLWTGIVRKLRLDLVNEFPGEIVLRNIEVLPAEPPLPEEAGDFAGHPRGWLYPAAAFLDGRLALRLPPGEYSIYCCGEPAAIRTTPASQEADGRTGLLGRVKCLDGRLELFAPALPEKFAVFITPGREAPVWRGPSFPERVPVELKRREAPGLGNIVFDARMPYWRGRMVAPRGGWHALGDACIRHPFRLAAAAKRAVLQVSADDVVQRVTLNGQEVRGRLSANWKEPSVFEVTDLVRRGDNLLAVKWRNNGGIGGLLYELTVVDAEGNVERVVSGAEAVGRNAENLPTGWDLPSFDGDGFAPVETLPAPPHSPWSCVLPYVDIQPKRGTVEMRAACPREVKSVAELQARVAFQGTPPLQPEEVAWVKLEMPSGEVLEARSGELKSCGTRQADGSYAVAWGDFALPQVGGELEVVLRYGVYGRAEEGRQAVRLLERRLPGRNDALRSELRRTEAGSPEVLVNGRPFYPVILSTFYRKKPTGFEHRLQGVNVRDFVCGGMSSTWWTGPGQYDFAQVDRTVNEYLRETPDLYFAAYVWCMPPRWYEKLHPERISRNSDGTCFDYYTATVTFSDAEYRADAARAVAALVRHLEEHFGSRILFYNLCGGVSLEWQGWGAHSMARLKRLADYSPAAARDFRAYAARRGAAVAGVPDYAARTHSADGLFRDPVADAAAMLYDEYYSSGIATCITAMAKAVKEACGRRKLVGAYYGYAFEYANMEYCVNSGGHNALAEVLASPDVDFLVSPHSYGIRAIGYPMEEMKPFASMWTHGKMSLVEDDSRTNLTSPQDYYQTVNLEQTRALLQRNWSVMLARRSPIYVFPIAEGNECDHPGIRADLEQARKAGQYIFERGLPRGAEIAVVVDEKSNRWLAPQAGRLENPTQRFSWYGHDGRRRDLHRATQPLTGDLVYVQRERLGQCGAPYDSMLLSDVVANAGRYKLWIFLNAFEDRQELRDALAAIRKAGGVILCAYGTGFLGEGGVSAERMSALLGMRLRQAAPGSLQAVWTAPAAGGATRVLFGPPVALPVRFAVADGGAEELGRYADGGGVAIARKGRVLFCGSNQLQPELIAEAARLAGVHLWCAPGDGLSAGCGIVSLHAGSGGRKRIVLPRRSDVVDVFSGEVVARGTDAIEIDMAALSTRTFLLGDAAEILQALGK